MAKAVVTSGWDKPLAFRYQMQLAKLMPAIRKYVPVGDHSHDQISGSYHKAGFPRTGGRLMKLFGKLGNYRAPKGQNKVTINIDSPYAAILEYGGTVAAVHNKRMGYNDGGDVIAYNRRGYSIQGLHMIEKGADDWVNALGESSGIRVDWAD